MVQFFYAITTFFLRVGNKLSTFYFGAFTVIIVVFSSQSVMAETEAQLISDLSSEQQNQQQNQQQNAKSLTDEIAQWRSLANNGDREAQFRLGLYFSSLQESEVNLQRAVFWYDAAAKQGHTLAQYNLGVKLFQGKGVDQDQNRAISLWLMAANAGHMQAQFNVGRAYFLGIELEEDHRKAKFWFAKAARQGDPKARDILKKLGWQNNLTQNMNLQQFDDSDTVGPSTSVDEIDAPQLIQSERPLNDNFVYTNPIDLYTGPNKHNQLIVQLPDTQGLTIVEKRNNDWYKVKSEDGFPVWIYQDYLKVDEKFSNIGIVSGKGVRARGVPENIDGSLVGFFQKGESLSIVEHQGEWYRVIAPSRFGAWINIKKDAEFKQIADN